MQNMYSENVLKNYIYKKLYIKKSISINVADLFSSKSSERELKGHLGTRRALVHSGTQGT